VRVLLACEFSGVVRRAFHRAGHYAYSCDLLPSDDGSEQHFIGDVRHLLKADPSWDMMIAFPPCTHLAVSGARWFKDKQIEQQLAIIFAEQLWNSGVPRIAIENPVGVLSTRSTMGKPTQIIQPWMFGHGEKKTTCLWLKGLPILAPTDIASGRVPRVHFESPGPDRWKLRSITYAGIADAMAQQWG